MVYTFKIKVKTLLYKKAIDYTRDYWAVFIYKSL